VLVTLKCPSASDELCKCAARICKLLCGCVPIQLLSYGMTQQWFVRCNQWWCDHCQHLFSVIDYYY
jgi:hypothetical protein